MSAAEPIVQVRDLHRTFGDVRAVSGISFDIAPGQVVGFIGANGAGKTTTMRMMVTLEQPDAGYVKVAGFDVVQRPAEARRQLGWMPDAFGSYDYMTVHEYLDFYARAFGFTGAARSDRVQEVMEFTDLLPLADRAMTTLSKGMNQRLCLGRTLLHDPPVLVLDEPAAGLDPKARVEFKHLVRLLAQDGKTLFISSHILSELEEMCDSLIFIDQGRLVHHGSAEQLKQHQDGGIVVSVETPSDPGAVARWCQLNENVEVLETTRRGARLRLPGGDEEALARLLRRMVAEGLPVTEFRREQQKLEDAFVNLLRNGAAAMHPPAPSASTRSRTGSAPCSSRSCGRALNRAPLPLPSCSCRA